MLEKHNYAEAHYDSMVNQKREGIPAFQDKRSVQSKLAIWDLGIMMEHENFGLKVTNNYVNRIVGDHSSYN